MESWRRGEIDWDGNPIVRQDSPSLDEKRPLGQPVVRKCMVVLNRLEDVPVIMTMTKLLASGPRQTAPIPSEPTANFLKVHCLRLMELTQRPSAVMKVSERHFERFDPLINVFRTFGKLNDVVVSAKMAIVPEDSFADSIYYQAQHDKTEMVIVPWTSSLIRYFGTMADIPQNEFVIEVLDRVEAHTGIMIDTTLQMDEDMMEPSLSRSISMSSLRNRAARPATSADSEIDVPPALQLTEGYHVFLPYFGGRDDRVAFAILIQLVKTQDVKATVVRIRSGEEGRKTSVSAPVVAHADEVVAPTEIAEAPSPSSPISSAVSSAISKVRFLPGLRGHHSTPVVVEHDAESDEDDSLLNPLLESIPADLKSRIKIETVVTSTPLQYAVKRAKKEVDSNNANYHLTILGRAVKYARANNLSAVLRHDLRESLKSGQNSETLGKSGLGDAAEAMILGHVTGGLLVLQGGKYADE
jgi:hypothetical protein